MFVDKYDKSVVPPIVVNPENIPEDLKKLQYWLNWYWKWVKNKKNPDRSKWSKPPINGTSTDASLTFDEAYQNHLDDPSLGIGITLQDAKLCGMDLDDILTKSGKIRKKYKKILKNFPETYIEISPSGTGYRIFGYGKPKTHGARAGCPVEVYHKGRYLTVTGKAINGNAGAPLIDIEEYANELPGKFPKEKSTTIPKSARSGGSSRTYLDTERNYREAAHEKRPI